MLERTVKGSGFYNAFWLSRRTCSQSAAQPVPQRCYIWGSK